MDKSALLIVYLEKALEEDLVDRLIMLKSISGFSLSTCYGYSREHAKLDLGEQVMGSRRLLRLELLHDKSLTSTIISELKQLNGAASIRYIISDVVEQGHIN